MTIGPFRLAVALPLARERDNVEHQRIIRAVEAEKFYVLRRHIRLIIGKYFERGQH